MSSGAIFLYIFVAGVMATVVWRLLGLFLSAGLAQDSPVIEWVRAVSTALVAGLVARTVLFPPGALADVSLPIRVGAFALGVMVYFVARRHLGLGILSGASALVVAQYALR
jgi:branched-subunit amino acid transport protein